jgi:hypothetical protein
LYTETAKDGGKKKQPFIVALQFLTLLNPKSRLSKTLLLKSGTIIFVQGFD